MTRLSDKLEAAMKAGTQGVLNRITDGRPMMHKGYAFTDAVSGLPVHYWQDRLGRMWMAEGRWSMFRVPTTVNSTIIAALRERGE